MVSILIPSRNERFLGQTIVDVLKKAEGAIEVIVNVDNDPDFHLSDLLPADPRVTVIRQPKPIGMRAGVVLMAGLATGDYLMKLDGHCLLDQGFDVKLAEDCAPNWVVIPRRYRLNEANWTRRENDPEPPIDYEHFIYPRKYDPVSLHGFRWNSRTISRAGIDLDDTLTFQGSCWFMSKRHWEAHHFLADPGYEGLPQQEAEEIGLTTRYTGGRVLVNKRTWFAHWFKGKENGIGYRIGKGEARRCYEYSYKLWVLQRRPFFEQLIDSFGPIPDWPENWKERLYGRA